MKRTTPAMTPASRFPLFALLAAVAGLVLLVAGAPVLWGCGDPQELSAGITPNAGIADSLEHREIGLIMDWVPWVLDIPVDVAQARGFYEQVGLKVHQIVPVEATDVVKFVATGKSEFGLYYAPDMLLAVQEGAPLLALGSIMSHAPVGLAFKPGLTPNSPAALVNKTASVPLIPSTRASFTTMLKVAGVDPEGVRVIDPGFDLVAPLLTGTVEAVAFTEFGELVEAEAQGEQLTYLDFRDWGTPDYAFLGLISNQDFAKNNPNVTRAFVRATLAGLTYAAAHPEEAVSIYVNAHSELDPALLLAQWKAALPYLALPAQGHPVGWQDLSSWQNLNKWMQTVGLTKELLELTGIVTNEYVGEG